MPPNIRYEDGFHKEGRFFGIWINNQDTCSDILFEHHVKR